jgi:hypothetical protein
MLHMRLQAIAAGLLMLAASVVLVTTLWQEPESIDGGTPPSAATGVIRADIRRSAAEPDRGVEPVAPPAEPQSGRAQITEDPEHSASRRIRSRVDDRREG